VLDAGFWGLVGASTLLVGAAGSLRANVSPRAIALTLGFGAAAFLGVLGFNLDEHAYELAGGGGALIGFVAGALTFFVVNRIVADRPITIGASLDALPGAALIALSIVEGGDVGGAVVAGVFLANLGESLIGSAVMKRAGRSDRLIMRLWSVVVLVAGASAALTYLIFNGVSDGAVGAGHAFATGAAVCMLADTLLAGAFEREEPLMGVVIALGFILGFGLSLV
jgi:ZIP family zinc transporter